MPLSLMYITNNPTVAAIAQAAGVNRLFVDMEYIGKETRQAGMNTVKSFHSFEDIQRIKAITNQGCSELLVRVNPIHEATKEYGSSREEIDAAIECGADILMLPMFKTQREIDDFLSLVNGRVKTMLLMETKEASAIASDIVAKGGFDEVHIGLNDLSLSMHRSFMFELLADGTVDRLTSILRESKVKFGFGGIARIGHGTLPAERIIVEHYRLGSQAAILSRSFCNANEIEDESVLNRLFSEGITAIREYERTASCMSAEQYEQNHRDVVQIVDSIVKG